MHNTTVLKQLEEILDNALIAAAPDAPIRSICEHVIEANSELIDELMEGWRLDYVTRLLRQRRDKLAREQRTTQLMLPGFERLPTQITVSNGRRNPLETATYRQLREYLVVLRRRQRTNPRIAQVQNLMALMRKWRKKLRLKKTQGLTVAEAMQREAQGREAAAGRQA
jgi:hypothetical protein